ncbi:MAG: hypothetical protein ACRDDX_06875 [Cellulosilyticaceae bacterium]
MQLEKIVREQNELVKVRQEVIGLLQEYQKLLQQWEAIEKHIQDKWFENLENAFKKLFKSKGFKVTEEVSDEHQFRRGKHVQAVLGCCSFYMTFQKEGKGNVIFGVVNPEDEELGSKERCIDDIQYKLLLEGPIHKCEHTTLNGKKYQLTEPADLRQLEADLLEKRMTLKELYELKQSVLHNKVAEEHYISNQNKIKLITTSNQYGVFHTLEELIERM